VVYLLLCEGDRLYTGITNDLDGRINAHREGRGAAFTKAFKPKVLVHAQPVADRSAALRLEAAIKKLPREKKLAALRESALP
jgi:putative endonuclease